MVYFLEQTHKLRMAQKPEWKTPKLDAYATTFLARLIARNQHKKGSIELSDRKMRLGAKSVLK